MAQRLHVGSAAAEPSNVRGAEEEGAGGGGGKTETDRAPESSGVVAHAEDVNQFAVAPAAAGDDAADKAAAWSFVDDQLANLRLMRDGDARADYPSIIILRLLSVMTGITFYAYNASLVRVDSTDEWNELAYGKIQSYPQKSKSHCAMFHHVADEPFALGKGSGGSQANHWLYLQPTSVVKRLAYDGTALSLKMMKDNLSLQKREGSRRKRKQGAGRRPK